MTVTVRSKISAGRMRRYREGRLGRVAERSEMRARPESTASTGSEASPGSQHTAATRRRLAGAPQDQAVYSCGCGYVFAAPVSTSVDCPHCGGTQAW
ncbi:MAG: hypothetical protein QOF83_1630 [Solirubrobacteraceae bacterium]|jgi:hypothetical protein|nr:hypothetical protein [Solirubrobacteraceae bacterium]